MRKILVIFLLMFTCSRAFGDSAVTEDSVKAAFIFHFISFTEWSDDQSDYNVCIPDDEGLRDEARRAFKDKLINSRQIIVTGQSVGCNILISNGYMLPTDSTLTIGQLSKGALFEFRVIDNKMKFAVDLDRVKRSKLKISSQLLKLAILKQGTP